MPLRETVTIKVTHRPTDTTRKLVLPEGQFPAYASLVPTILTRFSLDGPAELVYKDEDGDPITLSDADEFADLWFSAADTGIPIRFELRQSGPHNAAVTTPPQVPFEITESSVSAAEPDDRDGRREIVERQTVNPAENVTDPHEAPQAACVSPDPPRSTTLFEDPDDTPLPSSSEPTKELPSTSPPSTVESSSAHPGTFPDDPLDLPLPSSFDDSLPFSNLPNSLSSFLASLGTRSSTFSSTLASALSPTTPHSPTSRLSNILSASSLDDIPLVASSLVQMGSEFAEIARDVAMGVRREADEIRGEFSKLRDEVEKERTRFRDEIRDAFEQATTSTEMDVTGEDEGGNVKVNIGGSELPTPVDTCLARSPSPRPTKSAHSPPLCPERAASITAASSAASSVAPSSHDPSSSSPRSRSETASASATATDVGETLTVSSREETARLLHKEAKRARKEYRAAVRHAREEKRQTRRLRSGSGDAVNGTTQTNPMVLGGMPLPVEE